MAECAPEGSVWTYGVRRRYQGRHREQRGEDGAGMAREQVSEHGNLAAVVSAAH